MTRLPVHKAMTISAIMRIPVIWRESTVLRTGLSNSEGQFKFLNLLATANVAGGSRHHEERVRLKV
jgi:hypothetical protein